MNLLISACLIGTPCRYDGKSNLTEKLPLLMEKYTLIPVCGEVLGGLPTPRVPSERLGEKVISREGKDVTENFLRGAEEVLRLAKRYNCSVALLKERSPSCGCGEIYDGSFTKKLVRGNGVTAELLLKNQVKIFGESQIDELLLKEQR